MTAALGAALAAMIAQAIKASGAIVWVEPDAFTTILGKATEPLVVWAEGGFFSQKNYYLAAYKGLIFYTKSEMPIPIPAGAEIVRAKKIWIPG